MRAPVTEPSLRKALCDAGRVLYERGLIGHHRDQIGQSHGTSGHARMPGTERAGGEG